MSTDPSPPPETGPAPGAQPPPAPPPPQAADEEPSLGDAVGQLAATIRLGLAIVPQPTQGIARYARSQPRTTTLAIIATSTILFPLSKWLSGDVTKVSTFLSGLFAILLAHTLLGAALVAGLRIHFRRPIVARELLALFAASQLPFIPALLIGWILDVVKQGQEMYTAMMTVGLVLASLYLDRGLRELYQLDSDASLYFAALCYALWVLAFFAGIR